MWGYMCIHVHECACGGVCIYVFMSVHVGGVCVYMFISVHMVTRDQCLVSSLLISHLIFLNNVWFFGWSTHLYKVH